ncbi:hypothetical protein [Curtobacterium sp. TC1]|uniref:hypothetical protein n=1 Tax=Curtobacterium sp. TC1 TaxID=2862880 RepID=UPI0021C112E3|nr:hypothetical protein [Curtobacterium sp. TC1]
MPTPFAHVVLFVDGAPAFDTRMRFDVDSHGSTNRIPPVPTAVIDRTWLVLAAAALMVSLPMLTVPVVSLVTAVSESTLLPLLGTARR